MKNKEEIYRAFCHYYNKVINNDICEVDFYMCRKQHFVEVSEDDYKWLESIRNTEICYSIRIGGVMYRNESFFSPEIILGQTAENEPHKYYIGVIKRADLEIMKNMLEASTRMRR